MSSTAASRSQSALNKALYDACTIGDVGRVNDFVRQWADPLWESDYNKFNNGFNKACSLGQLKVVKALLQFNRSLATSENSAGWGPGHDASRYNQPEIVELLIRHGARNIARVHADPSSTPAGRAEAGKAGLEKVLKEKKITLSAYHQKAASYDRIIQMWKAPKAVLAISPVKTGVSAPLAPLAPSSSSITFQTPTLGEILMGDTSAAQFIKGKSLQALDAMIIAGLYAFMPLTKEDKDFVLDIDDRRVLHYACGHAFLNTVLFLLDQGANPYFKASTGETILDAAILGSEIAPRDVALGLHLPIIRVLRDITPPISYTAVSSYPEIIDALSERNQSEDDTASTASSDYRDSDHPADDSDHSGSSGTSSSRSSSTRLAFFQTLVARTTVVDTKVVSAALSTATDGDGSLEV